MGQKLRERKLYSDGDIGEKCDKYVTLFVCSVTLQGRSFKLFSIFSSSYLNLLFARCSLCVCEFYSIHSVPDPNITFFTLSFPSFTITSFLQFFSSLLFTSIYFMKHFYFFNGLLSFFLSLNKMEMILMTKMNGRADGQ